jgi:putative ABC transport system substrate-binding protein
MRGCAKELVGLQPDAILSSSTPVTAAVQRETPTIPIIFVVVADPVGAGFVASLARPGRNLTGFTNMEATMAAKWLELLTEIAPGVRRVAMMFNPDTAPGRGAYFVSAFEGAARSLMVESIITPVRSEVEIETVITALGRDQKGGFVVDTDGFLAAPFALEPEKPSDRTQANIMSLGSFLAGRALRDRLDYAYAQIVRIRLRHSCWPPPQCEA